MSQQLHPYNFIRGPPMNHSMRFTLWKLLNMEEENEQNQEC